ncbi:hypothetical protein C0585_01120 [Candidatus Woesearchaeota archaeon]|nr:MAG: hypothetical protein C0585_01120 [Candidatus Woesearchaeota archaeon]
MKKRLLIGTDNYLPRWDGISRFLSEIIPRLKDSFEITVIAPEFKGEYKDSKGIMVKHVPLSKFSFGDFTFAKMPNKKMIRNEIKDADIVFVQSIGPVGKSVLIEAKKQNKKLVGFNHSVEWELAPKALEGSVIQRLIHILSIRRSRNLYNKFDLLISPSNEIKEKFSWRKIKAKKQVVQLGIDTKKFVPAKNKNDAKKNIGIDPSQKVICYVGRLGREKDLKTLYRAYIRLTKDYNNLKLLIVGQGVESIEKMFQSRSDIIFAGNQNNVIPYYQASDIYVLPSLTETTSLSTLEAMACGVAPICTPVGLVRKYIIPGVNGLFFNKKNVYMLTKRIEKLLNNPGLLKEIQKNAIETVRDDFDWDITAKKIEEIFLKL